jgi:hypothetical protein
LILLLAFVFPPKVLPPSCRFPGIFKENTLPVQSRMCVFITAHTGQPKYYTTKKHKNQAFFTELSDLRVWVKMM